MKPNKIHSVINKIIPRRRPGVKEHDLAVNFDFWDGFSLGFFPSYFDDPVSEDLLHLSDVFLTSKDGFAEDLGRIRGDMLTAVNTFQSD